MSSDFARQIEQSEFDPAHATRLRLPKGRESWECVVDPYNLRIKIYGLSARDYTSHFDHCAEAISERLGQPFSKITVYALPGDKVAWRRLGFVPEGTISGFFQQHGQACIWSRFLNPERGKDSRRENQDNIVAEAKLKPAVTAFLPQDLTCLVGTTRDAPDISVLMTSVFKDYPSPLGPEHIRNLIQESHSHFRLIREPGGHLVAVMSAELDSERQTAEMTDCATLPGHRGRGLMHFLLAQLEQDLSHERGVSDFYTLARADQLGINCVFSKSEYVYTGRLCNNCRMPNGWESMNIWCKSGDSSMRNQPQSRL